MSRASKPEQSKLSADSICWCVGDGRVATSSVSDAAHDSRHPKSQAQLDGAITLIEVLELTGRRIVIAGSSLGSAGAWALSYGFARSLTGSERKLTDDCLARSNWECLGRWTLFASPVKHVSRLESDDGSPPSLQNAVAFVSANSPVAFVSLFPPQHLFTLPGTKSSVDLVATSKDEVLVLYRQGLARVCDIKSRELRRSMDRRTAESVVAGGGWHIWSVSRQWVTMLAADLLRSLHRFRAEKAIRLAAPTGLGSA